MLNIDRFFHYALLQDRSLSAVLKNRIYNTARDRQGENEDRIPYVIVSFDGAQSTGTKDMPVAGLDQATVSILCVEENREKLATLTSLVYKCIGKALDEVNWDDQSAKWDFEIDGITTSASAVQMDVDKPCLYQTLTYVCDTQSR